MAAGSQTIADIVVGNPDFSTLLAALKAANLVDVFTKPGTYTVFAPTNEAFAAALKSNNMTAASLLADVPTLTKILTYHVVAKKLVAADLIKLTSVTTLNGADIQIAVSKLAARFSVCTPHIRRASHGKRAFFVACQTR